MTSISTIAAFVSADRLWASILAMAEIGATANGGSNRLAFSREDDAGRSLFASWCEEAGLSVSTDAFGNMFARRQGRTDVEPLVIGSHLDTQPKGGRFDGVLGVLGGLEVVRALNDAGLETDRPIVIVNWTNEEGAVLTPMMGSAVFTGALALDEALEEKLPDGRTTRSALDAMKWGRGNHPVGSPMHCYLELHIEQGPILEEEGVAIGVVTGGIGFRRYRIAFTGQEAHAGPTPMALRKDPLVSASRAIVFADALGRSIPEARSTMGTMAVTGGSPNTVAARAEFTLDLRHPDAPAIAQMEENFFAECERIALETRTTVQYEMIADSPPAPFPEPVVSLIEDVTTGLGFSNRRMASGAGHDACNISRLYRTGMIFVPSLGGISHNEAEFTSKEECVAGVRVLANVAHTLLNL